MAKRESADQVKGDRIMNDCIYISNVCTESNDIDVLSMYIYRLDAMMMIPSDAKYAVERSAGSDRVTEGQNECEERNNLRGVLLLNNMVNFEGDVA